MQATVLQFSPAQRDNTGAPRKSSRASRYKRQIERLQAENAALKNALAALLARPGKSSQFADLARSLIDRSSID